MTVDKNRTAGNQADARAREFRLFVDAIEGERARLLLGDEAFDVPTRLLPEDTKEGGWILMSLALIPAPADDANIIRRQLTGGDDDGVIKL